LVSIAIAIPNLNGAKYLYRTLESLQNQIEKADEIVFSDNYSIDESLEIVKLFPDLKIRVIRPERFLKMSENWNYAVDQINSDWFFLLSNDDLLRDTAVKRLKEIVTELPPNIGVVSFKSEIINENSRLVLGKYGFGKSKIREEYEFLKQNVKFLHINAASVAIKRVSWRDIGKFPIEYSVLHDLVFYQRMISRWRILESKEVLGRYRIYQEKPNSEIRSKLIKEDFSTYERSDLKLHLVKYPDLLGLYEFKGTNRHLLFIKSAMLKNFWRKVVLSIMTSCRRIEERLGHSGFSSYSSVEKDS
jgi:glycosyltransferase involved in cell wall biosynthesis